MKTPYKIIGFIFSFLCSSFAMSADKLSVVSSFSVLGDITKALGGDKITLTTLVGPNQDSHVYKPTPFDVQALAKADVIVINGLAFEGWITRLEESSAFKGRRVVASEGADIIALNEKNHEEHEGHEEHDHGDFDPHAWHSLKNIRVYINNISNALIAADSMNKSYYQSRQQAYLSKVDALEKRLALKVSTVPVAKRQVIISHDAFAYIGREYQFQFLAPVGLNTQMKPSAMDVAQLIRQVKALNIKALFVENVSDDRLIKQIGRETGAKLGGHLYSDALSTKNGPAGTYLKMMEHNIDTLINELQ